MVCECKNKNLEKIAESYRGCDRDNGIHISMEYYENKEGSIFFRYIYDVWQGYSAEEKWKQKFSDFKPYQGKLTKQEIIDNPDSANGCEAPVILKRKCDHDLEKLAETKPDTSKMHKGTQTAHTEYFECKKCNLLFYKEQETGDEEFNVFWKEASKNIIPKEESLKDFHYNGYFLELELTKQEIVKYAPNCSGSQYGTAREIKKLSREESKSRGQKLSE